MPLSIKHRPVSAVLSPEAGVAVDSTDNDLLEAIAGGDRQAFAVLMRRYLPRMVALARRMVFDAEYAREIAQEAFLRVWVNAKRWDPDGAATFATWLRRVVINLAISHRRRRHDQVGLDAIEELASGEANGFDHVAADDQKRLMQKALQKLPARQRAAIALNYFEDLPRMEAAQAMQMNLKAFDSLLVRARASLKKQIVALGLCGREDL